LLLAYKATKPFSVAHNLSGVIRAYSRDFFQGIGVSFVDVDLCTQGIFFYTLPPDAVIPILRAFIVFLMDNNIRAQACKVLFAKSL